MKTLILLLAFSLMGCAGDSTDYKPTVYPYTTTKEEYYRNLAECEAFAEANMRPPGEYGRAIKGSVIGLVVAGGLAALTGAPPDVVAAYASLGAFYGFGMGMTTYYYSYPLTYPELVNGCLVGRGYTIMR